MNEIKIKINGDTHKARSGETLLKVARRDGVEIRRFATMSCLSRMVRAVFAQ